MSDLYAADASPLRITHKYLVETSAAYRIGLVVAPAALVVALVAGVLLTLWPAPPTLPPSAVPARTAPAVPAPTAASAPGAPPPAAAAPTTQPAPDPADLRALRDRAGVDLAALAELRARAEGGSAEAQYLMATLYDPFVTGGLFPKDAATTVQWYRKAADQGHVVAQAELGYFYAFGIGVPKDLAEAARWFRMAADQGNARAQNNLGKLLEWGQGVPQDVAEAAGWYRKSADQGNAVAQDNLGWLLENGQGGVAQDKAAAAGWFQKAADQGNAVAQNDLGWLYEQAPDWPKDAATAAGWYRKATDQGNAAAEGNLGRLYASGIGVPSDLEQALTLFRRAAAAGDPNSIDNLAMSLEKGLGTPRDPIGAYIWYRITTRWGNAAQRPIAELAGNRLGAEISHSDLAVAQQAAGNWQPRSYSRIGLQINDLTPDTAKAIGSRQIRGVFIASVVNGSPAQRAGLSAQDVITAVNGEPVAMAAEVRDLTTLGVPGQILTLWVEKAARRGSLATMRVQLERASP
jgi:hypothetical protein